MVPTYVMPYFGSNSAIINGVAAGTGVGMTPMWWAHAWCLAMLVVIAWLRGARIGKSFLPFLSITAGLFDMTPVLSVIPFVPTVFHVITLVLGVKGEETGNEKAIGTANRRGLGAAAVATVAAVAGIVSFVAYKPLKEVPKGAEVTLKASPAQLPGEKIAPTPTLELRPDEAEASAPTDSSPAHKEAKPKAVTPARVAKPSVPKSPTGNEGAPKASGTTVQYMKL